MIRLPPTSISLSESDIQFHLREINIYQTLLQQGFKQQDIQRYYAANRVAARERGQAQAWTAQQQGEGAKQSILKGVGTSEEVGLEPSSSQFQGRSQAALPVEQESHREAISGTKQCGSTETVQLAKKVHGQVVGSGQSDTRAYAPTTVELRTRGTLPTFQPFPQGRSDDHTGKYTWLTFRVFAELGAYVS